MAKRLASSRPADNAHPKETGGILIGVHTAGTRPWIVHAIEIPSKEAGRTHYVVPAGRRRKEVERIRKHHDGRLGYLGEWHSHPLDVGPSSTDRDSIRAIADHAGSGCARPVLLVARRVGDEYAMDARQLDRRSLRPLNLIAAGELLPVETQAPKRRSLRSTVLRR